MSDQTIACQNCKANFTIEQADFDFYKRLDVPLPTMCPLCRKIRRLSFRNERALYRDVCDLCKKAILSVYAPEVQVTVYCKECFFSDKWDPLEYGQPFDFSRPFFEQFHELYQRVPTLARMLMKTNAGSDYANYLADAKNVYLGYSVVRSENVMYSRVVDDSRDCVDCSDVQHGELCYEVIQSDAISHSKYLYSCSSCLNSNFLFDCVNCQNCFMSANLRGKNFVFRNEQLSKEEYQKRIGEINFGDYSQIEILRKEYEELRRVSLHKYGDIIKSVNVSGDNIANAKNVHHSFDISGGENLKYCDRMIGPKDCYDSSGAGTSQLLYDCVAMTFDSYMARFGLVADNARDSYYFTYCWDVNNIFGCMSLRKKQYCILNKQYTKEEYETLLPKVIQHMNEMPYVGKKGRVYRYGEFFPVELSPFAYNETLTQEYFPLAQSKVEEGGYRWRAPDHKDYGITRQPQQLPMKISDVPDSVLGEVIGCAHAGECNELCTTAFKVTPSELAFYRQYNIPLPHLCPNCRHYERLAIRNPHKLWERQCMCDYQVRQNSAKHAHHPEGRCVNEFQTTYSPERVETVYCEQCYQAEIA